MKKTLLIINLVLVFLLALTIKSNAFTYGITLNPETSIINKGENVNVKINLSNINLSQDEKGLLGFEAILEYDNDVLEVIEVEGSNAWSVSYSEATKKITGFILDKDKVATKESEIATVKLQANVNIDEEQVKNTTVRLLNIKASNGSNDSVSIEPVYTTINIGKAEEENPNQGQEEDNKGEQPAETEENKNQNQINVQNEIKNEVKNEVKNNTTSTNSLPKTGAELYTGILIAVLLVSSVIGYVQYKKNKNI